MGIWKGMWEGMCNICYTVKFRVDVWQSIHVSRLLSWYHWTCHVDDASLLDVPLELLEELSLVVD